MNKWNQAASSIKHSRERWLSRIKAKAKGKERILLTLGGLQVWSKPRRKDHQSKAAWHMEHFYREVARRLGISLREARSMPSQMLFEAMKKNKADQRRIREWYEYHISYFERGRQRLLKGKAAEAFYRANVIQQKRGVLTAEFRGACASPGTARGPVKIINSADEMSKMNEGDVLVSFVTNPSIISAMRKACAILTERGGLTCHAAIVSRELDIPCVVGLPGILSSLKDGDIVNIDAKKGIVRKMKK